MPRMRRIGNFIWSNLVSIIGNRRVADPASGMRVLRASALRQLYPLPDGLNFTPVMSTRCVHENLKVVEVPIAVQGASRPLEAEHRPRRLALSEDDPVDLARIQPGPRAGAGRRGRARRWPLLIRSGHCDAATPGQ